MRRGGVLERTVRSAGKDVMDLSSRGWREGVGGKMRVWSGEDSLFSFFLFRNDWTDFIILDLWLEIAVRLRSI